MTFVRLAGVVVVGMAASALLAQEGRGPQVRPVLQALDVNRDGTLSAAEIADAPAVLKTLDRNKDGQLDSLEYLPSQTNPADADPDALVKRLMVLDRNGDGVLTADEIPERLKPLMDRADTNHDGRLTADELRAYAKTQSQPQGRSMRGGQPTRMDPVLNALDADHDGVISAAEIANASAALLTLDKNGDGQLAPDELRPRQPTAADRVDHLLDEWDTNKDGKLSKEEMPDRMQAQFEAIDTNHDGFADKAELLTWFQNNSQMQRGPGAPGGGGRPAGEGKPAGEGPR